MSRNKKTKPPPATAHGAAPAAPAGLAETALAAQTLLAQRAAANGISIRQITSLDRLPASLDYAARPGDVLLIMGAGDINRMGYELTRNVS